VTALGAALQRDRFFGLRQVAAAALARIGSEPALAALRPGAGDPDARVRAAALAGFGSFSDHGELIPLLARAPETDASSGARAAAAGALGRFEDRRAEVTPLLLRALAQGSFLEEVPRAALRALADLGAPQAYGQALRLARYGSPPAGRADAMLAIAACAVRGGDAARRQEARKTLEAYLDDPDFEIRAKVPEALAALGDKAAIPALQRSLRAEVQDEQRRPREEALRDLQETAAKPSASQSLEERVRQLERANEVLEERLRELQEERAAPPAVSPAKPPRARGGS
jgi:HEAT repeat protein